ncbi:MAG TPA: DinB family protein, partial [Candidatus Krumholzibacteria bacterium]|nr:DinB family protein [Candidatus Krumholzibacteria bacterium]
MKWTTLLNEAIEDNYKTTDALMAMVGDADLGWKPATGTNWMTAGQLLMHLTSACGACCKGFVTGDWGMPEGCEMPEGESMLPPAEALPTVGSVAEARELLAKDKQVALAMVAQAGEDALENTRT